MEYTEEEKVALKAMEIGSEEWKKIPGNIIYNAAKKYCWEMYEKYPEELNWVPKYYGKSRQNLWSTF